jgi:hypothetical protein
MKSHPYEYKVMVEYINPEKAGSYPHFSHLEDQEGLTKTLEEVFLHLPQFLEQGWEVVSHDICDSRNTLIVTVMLKRLKPA